MVSHGSLSVNRDCDTIPQLSNYSTKYFLHFSDDKFKTIPDILKIDIQFSYPEEVSVTFTCKRIFLPVPQPNTKSLLLYAIYNSCKFDLLCGTCYFLDQQRQHQSSVFQNTSFKCKSAWLINYFNYYDSHLHLPFQLQLLQDVS